MRISPRSKKLKQSWKLQDRDKTILNISGCEIEEGIEAMIEFVVSSSKGPKLFEPIEESLNEISGLVSLLVIRAKRKSIAARRNNSLGPCGDDDVHEGIAVIPFVGDHSIGCDSLDQSRALRNVGGVATGQDQAQRITQGIYTGVNLGGQPTARTADRLIATVFLGAPAECWWARTTVESMNSSSRSASRCSTSATRDHTPLVSQRAKRIYTECQLPNSAGRSRQGLPTRAVYSTASTNKRLSTARPPLSVSLPGNNSEMRAHCPSLNIRRSIVAIQRTGCEHKSATVNRP